MGTINADNLLQFRPSKELFDRIRAYLSSYDSNNIIDEGDFYDYVVYILERLGAAVYKEHEAVIKVRDHKAPLPCNFKYWYAGYKCTPQFFNVPSINEQKPWIYYTDTEISQVCPTECCIECTGRELGKTKIVVRTFVNGDSLDLCYGDPTPLFLSPNVKDRCAPHCMRVVPSKSNEVTIDQDNTMHFHFTDDSIYLQYYGLPFDADYLPMIPDNPMIEQAIEYYIYKRLFEQWYLNSTVPDIGNKLQYINSQYNFFMAEAIYFCKMPTFQRMVQSVRTMKGNLKFYNFEFDRTVSPNVFASRNIYGNYR